MTITDLRYFEAVCICRSISGAAEYLHISQPSLSVAIKGLEDEFGVRLFERRHRGVVLTPEGEVMYARCRDVLGGFDELGRVMQDLGSRRRSIRIGVPPMIGSLILPKICGEFIGEHPDIRIDITEGGSQELSCKLSDGLVDMVFLTHIGELPEELSGTEVARLEVVCCASQDDEIAAHTSISPEDLRDRGLVLFNNSFYQTELIKKQFRECDIEPKIIIQTDQLSTATSVVESGVAVGFLFGELIKAHPRLVALPLRDKIIVSVSLAHRRSAYMSDSMKALRRFVAEHSVYGI